MFFDINDKVDLLKNVSIYYPSLTKDFLQKLLHTKYLLLLPMDQDYHNLYLHKVYPKVHFLHERNSLNILLNHIHSMYKDRQSQILYIDYMEHKYHLLNKNH